jgi:antitoxin component YwqK of YwqJK toxin-antitoxin module
MAAAVAQPFKISSAFTSAGAAAAFPADEEAICCLCHDGDSPEQPLLQVRVCSCKGSIRFHRDCVFEMAKHNPKCGACGKTLLNPDYVGLYYDAADPELAGARHRKNSHNSEVYGILNDFYHVAEADATKRHGICKVFYEQHGGGYGYKSPIPWTIYEVKHYDNGLLHGPYKRWSHFEQKYIQYPDVEATYDQGVLRGPFKIYDSYRGGRLHITGTLHTLGELFNNTKDGVSLKPDTNIPFGTDALYIGEYKMDEGGDYGITYHVTFAKPCKKEYMFAHDHAALAELASKLADGQHIIYYVTEPDYYGKPFNSDGRITFNVLNGLMEGDWTATLYNGDIVEQRQYKDGKLHGPYKRYCYTPARYGSKTQELHNIVEEGHFVDGKRHGKFTFYYKSGKSVSPTKKLVANYRHGNRIGQQTLYDLNGQILETTTLAEDGTGFLEGPAVFYCEGRVIQRCSFRLDELHGKMTLYTSSGMPWLQVTMECGKLRGGSWVNHYDETGTLDKAVCERVKREGDYLAVIGELDNYTVRTLASTDGDFASASFVEVRDEPEMHFYVNARTGKMKYSSAGAGCKCADCVYEYDEDECIARKALRDQASVDYSDDDYYGAYDSEEEREAWLDRERSRSNSRYYR